ncbi:GNAT family N-acetyltransferase [Kiloniella spongiae]|uniref:GNAT family N-acetyltransferase n=1 Tax=Kiloniella spongiae TaxID=1489064 RepID=UPI00069BC70A|nr:GNAT family N-acetyltransferase [Kiloniella spongiae]
MGLYKELRLEGLRETPEAFGASYRDESTEVFTYYCELLNDSYVFGVYGNTGILAGIAGLRISKKEKLRHKGTLWGMYIKSEARGNGLAKQLASLIIETAKETTEELLLTVVASNIPAVNLYKALGFIEYGIEPRALKVQGTYYDELLMLLRLET